jgi:RNA polymerase sigma-70 factor (ECF subfamily)
MPRALPSHTLASVLSRIQAGRLDGDAELARKLDVAFGKHEAQLQLFCAKELRGVSAAEVDEVVQDVLLEAWSKLEGYRPDRPFRAFLWGIALKKCANVRRKRRDVLSEDGLFDPGDEAPNVLGTLADAERDAIVDEAANRVLDASEQEVIHLRWVLDYPNEDIAEQMGMASTDEVRVVVQRSKRRLAKEIVRILEERSIGQSLLEPNRP